MEQEASGVIVKKGERVLLAPADYGAKSVATMLETLDLCGKDAVLQLPIVANGEDMKILEDTLAKCGIKTLVSENIYGLYFADKGYKVIAGAGHNVANRFAVECLRQLGAVAYAESIEYTQEGRLALPRVETEREIPLMTFAHCPFKTIYGNSCEKCSFRRGLTVRRERHEYTVRRVRLSQCYFGLFAKEK